MLTEELIQQFHKFTIVFDSVSRMSRNATEGVELYMDLFNKGVNLVFLKESYINTEVYKSTIEQTIGSTGNDIADIYIEATNKVIKLLAEKQIIKASLELARDAADIHCEDEEKPLASEIIEDLMKDRDLWEAKARTMIGFNDIYSFHERIIKIVLQTTDAEMLGIMYRHVSNVKNHQKEDE